MQKVSLFKKLVKRFRLKAKLLRLRVLVFGEKPNRYMLREQVDAEKVLSEVIEQALLGSQKAVLLVDADSNLAASLEARVRRRGLRTIVVSLEALYAKPDRECDDIGCVALASFSPKVQLEVAMWLVTTPKLAAIPFEYVAIPHLVNKDLLEFDRYTNADFVSPLVSKVEGLSYEIYRNSLNVFRPKTDIRDFFELSQIIYQLEQRQVPGSIAEFGSFYGHSGYLISTFIEALGSDKKLFMFDMFDHFPEEEIGVDSFWSGTHKVDFSAVQAKFQGRGNVELVKGDFTKTFAETDTGDLALAFIDCDSYRGTQYLLNKIWDRKLALGGVVVLEDYGHAALLGNRVAAHEFFDKKEGAYTYFSQLSGFFVAVKVAN
ncbi:MAG: hypothetical protein CMN84_09140 [Spongiibacteraceae bacterium]|nr:hypothetical protein [Spongiibacteraceae bacterium]